jgi:hypothetical protein
MTTDRWPSPRPGPAWQTWRNCWDHIETVVLAGVSLETYNVVRKDPAVAQAETRAAEMAGSGDALATNASCNAWVRAIRAALAAHNAKDAA